ncbi:MAG: LamG-like jellyroll fold domain-containing protein, partial [Polyangiaceae bacterium]
STLPAPYNKLDVTVGGCCGFNDPSAPLKLNACRDDLSNDGTADFHIGFTVQTTQTGQFAAVNQRNVCNGPSNWWDIRVSNGLVGVETGSTGNANYVAFNGCTPVNDGNAHVVYVQRNNGVLTLFVDGKIDGQGSTTSTSTFSAGMTALTIGSDPCDGQDATVAFDKLKGSISNVCVGAGSSAITTAPNSACY